MMHWTKTIPTAGGWYWMRRGHGEEPQVIHVENSTMRGRAFVYWRAGSDIDHDFADDAAFYPEQMYAGPIAPPSEPPQ